MGELVGEGALASLACEVCEGWSLAALGVGASVGDGVLASLARVVCEGASLTRSAKEVG